MKKKIVLLRSLRKRKSFNLYKESCRNCFKFPCYGHTAFSGLIAKMSSAQPYGRQGGASPEYCDNWEGKTLKDYQKVCPTCGGKGRTLKTIDEICNSTNYEEVLTTP